MRRSLPSRLNIAILACGALISGVTQADSERADSLRVTVTEAAQAVMQRNDIAGMSIAISEGGRQHFYNFGVASRQTGQPVTRDTLFELGSISKTFTATLATWAQTNGQLSLTENIDTYMPQLQGSRLGKLPVYHLATHTAGGFPLQVPDKVSNDDELMAYFKAWQPQYLPGTHRSYANPSIGLLGVVAARSLKLPFEQAMEQQLFPALGLNNTWLDVPDDKLATYAQGYDKTGAPVRLNAGVLAAQAYGVKSTSRDLLRFVEANLQARPLETPLQRALLDTRTGYFEVGAMVQDLAWEHYRQPVQLNALLEGNSSKMALNTQPVLPLKPFPGLEDTWVNKTGSTNGFGGYVAFVPGRQLGIVVLANRNYPNEERVKLAYRILSELGCCSAR
ncbi:beta-lactamase [Pseudomonas sp. v388]|uniref:class C beta-lactamase n=1 Tax=Pseudomonas sp. v388 TaxID=2479849 RepID=UPI000F78EC93|nr:class C beta-lactamase [Pseudomonas sp. v388]RRV07369.1 beta-lactamase [Pseudomonas sp. v388]